MRGIGGMGKSKTNLWFAEASAINCDNSGKEKPVKATNK